MEEAIDRGYTAAPRDADAWVWGANGRRRRCSDHNNVRPQYPLKFSGLDGRNSGRAGMSGYGGPPKKNRSISREASGPC
jgi:hypothetical protein